jgi:DNA-binding MarR family transcriptional regulator
MPLLLSKDLPRHECLIEASREFPDLDPSATQVFLTLLRAGDEAFRVVESHLGAHQITSGRFAVLMALWRQSRRDCGAPALTPAELADQTSVTRATMTGLIDTLERDGFVKRQPAPADRRMTTVQLTSGGMAIVCQILPGHFQRMAALMGSLSAPERDLLTGLLRKIIDQANIMAPANGSADASPSGAAA